MDPGTGQPQDEEQIAASPQPPPWPPPKPPQPPPPQPPPPQPPPPPAPPLPTAPLPKPVPQFCPEPSPELGPEAPPELAAELETDPIPEPDSEPAPELDIELDSKQISEPGPKPAREPVPESAPEPAQELVTESATEPASECVPGIDSEPTPEPVPELDSEPTPEPVPDLDIHPAPEWVPEPAPDSALEPVPGLDSEPAPELVPKLDTDPAPEPLLELPPEPAPESDPELAPKSVPEPIPESATDSCPEPIPESCPEPNPAPCLLQRLTVAAKALTTPSLPRSPRLPSSIKRILKEGPLMKSCNSFQRWKVRYFLVRGQNLYFAHHPSFARFETIDLSQVALAESSCRNLWHSFSVITPEQKVTLAAPNRKDMEEWINVIKTVQQGEIHKIPAAENNPFLVGMHYWYASQSSKTQHCNICREAIPALSRNVIVCEVCKVKSHKLCALRASKDCKWNTLSVTDDLLLPANEIETMPHQWVEGNISVDSQCAVCHKKCGSNQRLQDYRCLWCHQTVHDDCRRWFSKECCCGSHHPSIIPPTAISDPKGDGQLVISSDFWNLDWSSPCSCPLLIFINSKSGDHQGVVFLRKFKQYLNPSQVFDLSKGGPEAGLCMFKNFARFRIVVCGGDGSISWVLSVIDDFGLHERCQLAVVPLGTGNDLARILGWGAFWNKNKSPLNILNRVEQARVRILDRWSVMIRETPRQTLLPGGAVEIDVPKFEAAAIRNLESANTELNKILRAKYPTEIVIAARFLCSAVEDFMLDIVKVWSRIKQNNTAIESVILKSDIMYDKLSVLIDILTEEGSVECVKVGAVISKAGGKPFIPQIDYTNKCKLELATKAQNLQKSLKLIVFQVEQVLDEQSRQTISVKNFSSAFCLEDDSEDISQMSARTRSQRDTLASISSLKNEDLEHLNLEYLHLKPETIRFKERCVMNNYFGIGLDAKISLEFNTRRDEHPYQYNNRLKNKMWYGLLGSKEIFQRSYRKLEERVHLECDGEAIYLPNLQGIVVLNITSYAGGINFWGSSTATTEYEAPAIDDGKLEVVAIFGSMQMAMSRIINLHHHRIAQCREVMITIDGDEGIPVQVDGEAWVQMPGLIKIRYKNAAQMLTRDRDFENSMQKWECKHAEIQAATQPQLDLQEFQNSLLYEEYAQIQRLAQLADILISRLTDLNKVQQYVYVLMDSVNASAKILNEIFYSQHNESGAASCTPTETISRNDAIDVTFSLKGLYDDTKTFLDENLLRNVENEAMLKTTLDAMNQEFEKLSKIDWINPILFPEEEYSEFHSRHHKLKIKFPKFGKRPKKEDKAKSRKRIQSILGNLWHRRNDNDDDDDDYDDDNDDDEDEFDDDESKYDDPSTSTSHL